MNVRMVLVLLCLVLAGRAYAQGFAGLGNAAEGYALPDPATRFVFPQDHGTHPEFRIEWWYITANLTDPAGTEYGIQWTLFRNALRPGISPEDQAWMGHAAVSGPEGHLFAERFARGGLGQAGVRVRPFEAFIDEWRMAGPDLSELALTAQGTNFALDLELRAEGPFVPQGQQGYSVKSENGLASHYYSQPFYQVAGTLILPGGPVEVTGQGWLDREWSSQPLGPDQTGWDWISLHFADGEKLMGYRIRSTTDEIFTTGTWISADGAPTPLSGDELEMTPLRETEVAGRRLPILWRVRYPRRGIDVRISAFYEDSWMSTAIPYWEGPVSVAGSHRGRGYLEMSGY